MAGEKRLSTLADELLEDIAGGTLTEFDEKYFSVMIEATKEAGQPVDYLLAIVDDVYRNKPGLHDEIYQYIFENWDLALRPGGPEEDRGNGLQDHDGTTRHEGREE